MSDNIKTDMLNKKVWAVLGATENREKFGYKIYKILKDNNYEVYPVNPKYDSIDGDKCYDEVLDLPVTPDVLNFVVPPKLSIRAIDEAKDKGIENLWFQPGTFDNDVMDKVENIGLEGLFGNCVLVELG